LVDDLREFEHELGADEVSWRFGLREHLGTWSWKNVYTQSHSLDELSSVAPKGAVYQFEVQARFGEQSFVLLMVSSDPRFVTFSYEGPEEEIPDRFWAAMVPLKKAEKRGQRWHYVGAVIAPALALTIPLFLLDNIGRLGLFYDEAGPPGDLAKAATWGASSFLFLTVTAALFWSWARLSSVTLRPFIDTSSVFERVVDRLRSAGRWAFSVPKADYLYKLIMLWATVVAALCGAGAFVVAIIALLK
jgi:hypothetical protein